MGLLLLVVRLVLASLLIQPINCAKILFVPFNHKSHMNIFTGLGEGLSEDGHDVWILTEEKFRNSIEQKSFVPLTFHLPEKADFSKNLAELMEKDPTGKTSHQVIVQEGYREFGLFCEEVLKNIRIMKAIKDNKFDLVVLDGLMAFACMYTIPYKFGIPYITIHSFQTVPWTAGVTGMPSIEPDIMLELSNRMNFWERLANLKNWLAVLNEPVIDSYDRYFLQTYVPEKPLKKFKDIVRDSEMVFLIYEIFCLDYPRVSAPNYKYLGPSTASPVKLLPENIEEFIEGAEHGIVVMTLGSFTAWQFTWKILRDKMFTAFGRLKQRVIIQYSLEGNVVNIPDNILLLKWVPQNDILGHPKTKLFITHGGNNGQNEGVYHGVPMLVMPISIDQRYAGLRTQTHGYGLYVKDLETVTSDEVFEMMNEILYNESYSANIKKCSQIVRSMPTGQERFVLWVNHILQFGGSHLRPPSLDMPLYQVLMLDIVAFYVAIGLLIFHACIIVAYFGYKYISKGSKYKHE